MSTGRVEHREDQHKREKCIIVRKAEMAEPSEPFDIRHGVKEFGVFPGVFRSCFHPVFSPYALLPQFWKDNVCSVSLYVGIMYFSFWY